MANSKEENKVVFDTYTVKYLVGVWIAHNGHVTKIAKLLNCTRPTVYKHFRENKTLALHLDFAIQSKVDEVEQALFLLATGVPIMKGNKFVSWDTKPDYKAIEKFLDTFGEERGYQRANKKEDEKDPEPRTITIVKKIITK